MPIQWKLEEPSVIALWTKRFGSDVFLKERTSRVIQALSFFQQADAQRPVMFVAGSATSNEHLSEADLLGRTLAERGWHLVTGGRGGVMQHVTKGFLTGLNSRQTNQIAVGIIPKGKAPNALHPVERVLTELPGADPLGPDTRNHVNVIVADRVIVMPGDSGTCAEAELGVSWYQRPVVGYPQVPSADSKSAMEERWHARMQSLGITCLSVSELTKHLTWP